MATPTYDLLDSTTLSSSASSVTFSSIDQNYRDLVLVCNTIAAGNSVRFRYNGDTNANYYYVRMLGDGSSASSASFNSSFNELGVASTSGSVGIAHILDYSATDKHKSSLSRSNDPSYVWGHAHRWASTSAITQIQVYFGGGNASAGSTFYLYGVAA